MTNTCSARLHNTEWAYRRCGCRCDGALQAEQDKAALRRQRKRGRAQRPKSTGRDYDWVKVDRAVKGDMSLRLTVPELADAIDRLERRQWSAEEIASCLGITQRTVQRHRAARREAANKIAAALAGRRSPMSTPKKTERSTSQGHRTAHPRQDQAA